MTLETAWKRYAMSLTDEDLRLWQEAQEALWVAYGQEREAFADKLLTQYDEEVEAAVRRYDEQRAALEEKLMKYLEGPTERKLGNKGGLYG